MQKYFSVIRVHVLFSADRIRPYISGWQGGSNYINAVYVDVSNDYVRYNKMALDMCKCCTNSCKISKHVPGTMGKVTFFPVRS